MYVAVAVAVACENMVVLADCTRHSRPAGILVAARIGSYEHEFSKRIDGSQVMASSHRRSEADGWSYRHVYEWREGFTSGR